MRKKLFAVLSIILVFIAIVSIVSFGIFLLKNIAQTSLTSFPKVYKYPGIFLLHP